MVGNDRDWHGEIRQKFENDNDKRYVIKRISYKKKLKINLAK